MYATYGLPLGIWRSHLVWRTCNRPDAGLLLLHGPSSHLFKRLPALNLYTGLQVLSSIIAAWADISDTLTAGDPAAAEAAALSTSNLSAVQGVVGSLNVGYLWMLLNCATSAAYVLTMRKRIKATGFSDWDTMFYNNLLSIPVLVVFSIIVEDWGTENLILNL